MSLGLIADDQGCRHHLLVSIHHLIRTRTEKQNKKEKNISVDANNPLTDLNNRSVEVLCVSQVKEMCL